MFASILFSVALIRIVAICQLSFKHMSRKLFLLISCLIASAGFIVLLQIVSLNSTRKQNKFIRLFPPHIVQPIKAIDLTYNSFYFAGRDSSHIYFANATTPDLILKTDLHLSDTQLIKLINNPNGNLIEGLNTVKINSDS